MLKLNKLLWFSTDLICTIDAAGRFVDVSHGALAILGYPPAELSGKFFQDLILPADLDDVKRIIDKLCNGQHTAQTQNRYIHKNDNWFRCNGQFNVRIIHNQLTPIAKNGLTTINADYQAKARDFKLASKGQCDWYFAMRFSIS